MHVRGFTRHPSSGCRPKARGTYAGLIEKIPYLQELGITAVELLPVFQFDAQDAPAGQDQLLGLPAGLVLRAASGLQLAADPLGPVNEFRDMVKALHRAGIEVILDVVFNHTRRGRRRRARRSAFAAWTTRLITFSTTAARSYANYTGCGNTLNAIIRSSAG